MSGRAASFRRPPTRRVAGVVALLALGAGLVRGEEAPTPRPAGEEAPVPPEVQKINRGIDPAALKLDKDLFMFKQVEDKTGPPANDGNTYEHLAYNQVLLHARQFPQDALEAHARRDVTFRDLVVETRKEFQFDLVYFEGRLFRLRKLEPTVDLARAGVPALYEAWVFPDNTDVPLCVVCTELPAGLEPAMEYNPPQRVAVGGYSFKLMRYQASDPDPRRKTRLAPLLMSHSLRVLPAPPVEPSSGGTEIVTGVVGLVGVVLVALFGLMWYFRVEDRAHRRAAAARQERNNPFDPARQSVPADDEGWGSA